MTKNVTKYDKKILSCRGEEEQRESGWSNMLKTGDNFYIELGLELALEHIRMLITII